MVNHVTTSQQIYQKAPVKMELDAMARAKRSLRFLAGLSFLLSIFFFVLMNPFLRFKQGLELVQNFRANTLDEKLENLGETLSTAPEFLGQVPAIVEEQTFKFFDWTEAQVKSVDWQGLKEDGREQLQVIAGLFKKESEEMIVEIEPALTTDLDPKYLPFYIEIPELDIYQKVNPEVNANVEEEYQEALKDGVAHALGSAFPGQGKLIYIFGHSTNGVWNVDDYNAVFYQIKDLEEGDKISLYWGDERFDYEVIGYDVIPREDTDFINEKQGEDLLILQTCWPPGTSWQRLFITAKAI